MHHQFAAGYTLAGRAWRVLGGAAGGTVPRLPAAELLGLAGLYVWRAEPEERRRSLRTTARTRTHQHVRRVTLVVAPRTEVAALSCLVFVSFGRE